MNKSINIFFDRYSFPVNYMTLKNFILGELKMLSASTGYSIKGLPVEFEENGKDSTIAYFSSVNGKPNGFCFYLNMFENTSANKIIDTVRHEFAHFIVCVQTGDHPSDPHGAEWKKVCAALGAIPSAFMNNLMTRHF